MAIGELFQRNFIPTLSSYFRKCEHSNSLHQRSSALLLFLSPMNCISAYKALYQRVFRSSSGPFLPTYVGTAGNAVRLR